MHCSGVERAAILYDLSRDRSILCAREFSLNAVGQPYTPHPSAVRVVIGAPKLKAKESGELALILGDQTLVESALAFSNLSDPEQHDFEPKGSTGSASEPLQGSLAVNIKNLSKDKEFAAICELAKGLSVENIWNDRILLNVVEAYANEHLIDDVKSLITATVFGYAKFSADVRVLVRLYAFEAVLELPVRKYLRQLILMDLKSYKGDPGRLLHVAHQALVQDDIELFAAARLRSHALCDGRPEVLAKHDIQDSQLAFLLGNYPLQLDYLNRALGRSGLDSLRLRDSSKPVSARNVIASAEDAIVGDLPLVSVVMTTFNRELTVEYAVRSIINQTYRNIELIIVDDCSSDGTVNLINALTKEYDFIRVMVLEQNVGTYVAKNKALSVANGDLVTCQDSDDFAHPQKIETAVKHLLRHDDIVATTVQHVRCNEQDGYKSRTGYIRKDFSSLLFRRSPVLERIGFFDSCRAGADAEFQTRIRRAFGQHAIADLPQLGSIVDAATDSLTGSGDFAMNDDHGVMSPLRNAYRRAFLKWHASSDTLFVPFPLEERPFVFE